MTFEVGVRNAGLGLLLVFTYFDGLGGMALVAAWWGIWDIIAGLVGRHRLATAYGVGRAGGGAGMRVLVTGGSGFLGTSVVTGLAAGGADVTSADLRVPDVAVPAPGRARSPMSRWTCATRDASTRSCTSGGPRSSCTSPRSSPPARTPRASSSGPSTSTAPRNVLDACLTHEVRRIVVSSSGAAYGYHPDNPEWITEDQPVRGNEEFAYADHKRHGRGDARGAPRVATRTGAGGAPHRHDPRRARRQPDHGAVRCARGC